MSSFVGQNWPGLSSALAAGCLIVIGAVDAWTRQAFGAQVDQNMIWAGIGLLGGAGVTFAGRTGGQGQAAKS